MTKPTPIPAPEPDEMEIRRCQVAAYYAVHPGATLGEVLQALKAPPKNFCVDDQVKNW